MNAWVAPSPFLPSFFFAWSWMTWSCEICPHKLSFQCSTAVASGQDLGLFLRCKQFMSVQTEVFWEGMEGSLEHIHIQWKGGGVFRFSVKREWCCLVLLPAPRIQTMTQIHETGYGVEKRWNFHMKSHQNALGPPGASLLTAALHFYSFENSTFHPTLRWLNPDVDGAKVLLAIIWPKGSTV